MDMDDASENLSNPFGSVLYDVIAIPAMHLGHHYPLCRERAWGRLEFRGGEKVCRFFAAIKCEQEFDLRQDVEGQAY